LDLLVFTHIFTGILIFKGLTARRLYTSFGVKGLKLIAHGCVTGIRFSAEEYLPFSTVCSPAVVAN
jgi:hypothetical protein